MGLELPDRCLCDRVYYSAGDKSFGGAIPGESSGCATLYATSDDGVVWGKPHLHRYKFGKDSANNILFDGTTALGFYDDSFHDQNTSARFKVWGNLPGDQWQGGAPKAADSATAYFLLFGRFFITFSPKTGAFGELWLKRAAI